MASPLFSLTIARSGLRLELRVNQHKGRPRLRLHIYEGEDSRRDRTVWLSHEPTDRISEIVESLPDTHASDLTEDFKTQLLADPDEATSAQDTAARGDSSLFEPTDVMMSEVDALSGRERQAPSPFNPTESLRDCAASNEQQKRKRSSAAEQDEAAPCMKEVCVAARLESDQACLERDKAVEQLAKLRASLKSCRARGR